MGLFNRSLSSNQKQVKAPLDRPPPFEELIAPEPPKKAVMQMPAMPSMDSSGLAKLPDDLSLPSLDEEFKPLKKPLKPESFGLPPLEDLHFPEPEFKPMGQTMQGPLFPEIPKIQHEAEFPQILLPTFKPEPPAKAQPQKNIQGEPNFVNIQDYLQTRSWLKEINQNTDVGEDTVYRLNELDQEAEKHYARFGTNLEYIQRKLLTIERILFKG